MKNKSKNGGEPPIKKSILKLMGAYGLDTNNVIKDIPLSISDFDDDTTKQTFCDNVLNFQYSIIGEYLQSNNLDKYFAYATGKKSFSSLNQLYPKLLIAPYFYLNSLDANIDGWLKMNIEFLELSIKLATQKYNGLPVFGQIVLSKETLLDKNAINNIVKKYRSCKCQGYTIWIDGLDEHEASLQLLSGFINCLKGLKGKPVYNMYGGYFSIMLTHSSIDLLHGVSHGMEYGESREVYPVGGGIPVSKYYFMPLHQRKDFTKAFYFLEHNSILNTSLADWGDCKQYYDEICRCEKCQKIMENSMINFVKFESDQYYDVKRKNQITRRKKASAETKENCLYHYLLCKRVEFGMVQKQDIKDILQNLINEKKKYESCAYLDAGELDYIDRWNKLLNEFH